MEGGEKRRTHPDHLPCDDKVRGLGPARDDVGACAALGAGAAPARWDTSVFASREDASVCTHFLLWLWSLRSPVGLGDLNYL